MKEKVEPHSKFIRYFFFTSGIVATIAYRIIFLLDAFWIQVAWYVGTIGFMLYFGHRYQIELKRAKLAKDYNLLEAVSKSDIEGNKREALSYLIETSITSKSRYNSLFIFIASAVVFVMSVIKDLY